MHLKFPFKQQRFASVTHVPVLLSHSVCGLQPAGGLLCAGLPPHRIGRPLRPAERQITKTTPTRTSGNRSGRVCRDFNNQPIISALSIVICGRECLQLPIGSISSFNLLAFWNNDHTLIIKNKMKIKRLME